MRGSQVPQLGAIDSFAISSFGLGKIHFSFGKRIRN